MLDTIDELDFVVVDEPLENDSHSPSADTYYSTSSTSNRIIVTKISSQISGLKNYFDFDDEVSLESELKDWDILSDEALINFEATLD